ncbi:NAD(P)-binding protein [Roseobacter sp. YSTF-M11]|uniref:NAD(P)-binding protein n=1 Tax=Roseobacter insulae TaxID=2859783 RepID=A0A9X1K269_9RHOB|nr:NAD(P)-binding protein [Roseobacter insulae]MBW4708208.1 NAD(P)-binding protein [Roseobacter insulae]
MSTKNKIAIIGAGISGLCLAHRLKDVAAVRIFEKSRGMGGRMATRRAGAFRFDHGAQYFAARGEAFKTFLAPFIRSGVVQAWQPRLTVLPHDAGRDPQVWTAPRYVATPGMNGLAKQLGRDLDVVLETEIGAVTAEDSRWRLTTTGGHDLGLFDWVISTAPAAQTDRLLPADFFGHAPLKATIMQGCYSLMLAFDHPLPMSWDAAHVAQDPLAWIAVNATKPGRGDAQCIVAQSSNSWAAAHMERDQGEVRAVLVAAFEEITGQSVATAAAVTIHRWRYANVVAPAGQPFLLDKAHRLAAAGDWCGTGKIEAAFESATGLAEALLPLLHRRVEG